jgi:hypothetical protein
MFIKAKRLYLRNRGFNVPLNSIGEEKGTVLSCLKKAFYLRQ